MEARQLPEAAMKDLVPIPETRLAASVKPRSVANYGETKMSMEDRYLARMKMAGVTPVSSGFRTPRRPVPKLPTCKPEVAARIKKILKALDRPMLKAELKEATGIEVRALDRALARLIAHKVIRKQSRGAGRPAVYMAGGEE